MADHGAVDPLPPTALPADADLEGDGLLRLTVPLVEHWRLLVYGSLIAGLATLGMVFLMAPTFTARTTFLPPQQQQNSAASALASLGALAGLAGGAVGLRTPADQYVALMQSTTVSDRLIDQFGLMTAYDADFRVEARRMLDENVRIAVGKKDGLIAVEVDDKVPSRAAAIANAYVEELRRLTSTLAITEAQQRRAFFERQLQQTRDKLTSAQLALQSSGFSQGALRAEPKAAAEAYARLRAEATAAEVRLQAMRSSLADQAPEVISLQSALAALRAQLAQAERATDATGGPDYLGKYREFKYQETLFELFARQYELARVDESREGALIQVVDEATPPERKSRPKRLLLTLVGTIASLLTLAAWVILRESWRESARRPANSAVLARFRRAIGGTD